MAGLFQQPYWLTARSYRRGTAMKLSERELIEARAELLEEWRQRLQG